MLKALGSFFVLLLIAVIAIAYTFGTVVPPGSVGVRQIAFGPYRGFSTKGLVPGYHWSVPFYSTVHLIPQNLQALHFDRSVSGEDGGGAVEVQTTDGSSVDVDVSILSRFYPDVSKDHGGPADLIQRFGTSRKQWVEKIRTACINEIRKALGRLSTSDFYVPEKREVAIKDAHIAMNQRLGEYGVKVEAILMRRYTYTEERIDTAIFQKNLQDQEGRLNVAASLFAQAKADLEKISAEWDAKIKTLRVQGENKARVIKSEANLFETEKRAGGDLAVAKARAEVDRLKASALSKSVGAEVYVGKELAPLLTSLKGGIVADIDPYDLNKWAERFGVGAAQGGVK